MNIPIKYPPFGRFLDQLKAAGVQTDSARGFWGGVTPDGDIVVTAWIDERDEHGRFVIWRPKTNHGGLKIAWEVGNIHVGAEVRVILVRPRGKTRTVSDAALTPGKWRIVAMENVEERGAAIEPVPS